MTVRVFVSYSHMDEHYLEKDNLVGFLKGLEQNGGVEFWIDTKLNAGDRWDDEIKKGLEQSDIALILVSQAFLDSSYCIDIEIAGFMLHCRNRGLLIFPIILSPCEWEKHQWLHDHQFLPSQNETIEEHYQDQGKCKRLFLRIRKELRMLIDQVEHQKTKLKPQAQPEAIVERRKITLLECALTATDNQSVSLERDDLLELLYEIAPEFHAFNQGIINDAHGHILELNHGTLTACFGYPMVGEDDGLRAVKTAFTIIDLIPKQFKQFSKEWGVVLGTRVAIHTGLVICTTRGVENNLDCGSHREIVTAMQKNTDIGQVIICQDTQRLIAPFYNTQPVNDLISGHLKESIKCWQILSQTGDHSRFSANLNSVLDPLFGRDKEKSIIEECAQRVMEQNGQCAVINGDGGIGKSHLLAFVKQQLTDDFLCMECQASFYYQETAFYPLVCLLRSWAEFEVGDSDSYCFTKLKAKIKQVAGDADDLIPLLSEFLSLSVDGSSSIDNVSAQKKKELLNDALSAIFIEISLKTPLLLIFEDLHWLDPSSTHWLSDFLDNIATVPIFVLCTSRPHTMAIDFNQHAHCTPIKLGPLNRQSARDMVLHLVGKKTIAVDFIAAIFNKTGGYPLFIAELVRMLMDNNPLSLESFATSSLEAMDIPDTLQGLLMARLNTLGSAKSAAQTASVLGKEFSFDMISAIATVSKEELKDLLEQLVNTGLLHRREVFKRLSYVFRQTLTRDALYHSMLKQHRIRSHLKIAKSLNTGFPEVKNQQPEILAYHYNEANEIEEAVNFWLKATEASVRSCANVEAIAHANHALLALKKRPSDHATKVQAIEIQHLLGMAFAAVKGWGNPDTGSAFRCAVDLCKEIGDPQRSVPILIGLRTHFMVSAEITKSLRTAKTLTHIGQSRESNDVLLQGYAGCSNSSFWLGDHKAATDSMQSGLEIYCYEKHYDAHVTQYGLDPYCLFIFSGSVSSWLSGEKELARSLVTDAENLLNNFNNLFSLGFILLGITWFWLNEDNPEKVVEYSQKAIKMASDNHLIDILAMARVKYGWALNRLGKFQQGIDQIVQGMDELEAAGASITFTFHSAILAEAYRCADRDRDALIQIDKGLLYAESAEAKNYWAELYRIKGEILSKDPQTQNIAKNMFVKSVRIAQSQGAHSFVRRSQLSMKKCFDKDAKA